MIVPAPPSDHDFSPAIVRQAQLGRLTAVGLVLVLCTAAGPFLHMKLGGLAHWAVVAVTAAGAAWAALSNDRCEQRRTLWVILGVGVALRLALLFTEPYLSDDIYRYVWDGRVQANGINPYRYIPAAPELTHLRDLAIYPLINRADYAPTIYPPAAQMFFLAVTRAGESVFVMKLGLVAMEGLAIAASLGALARLGLPATRIAAFAWHPLPVWEIAGSGHIDAAMLGLMMVGVVMMLDRRILLAGAFATAAALVKPISLLLLPVLWRPWSIRLPAVVAATALVLYLPYLSVGSKVLGFLTGYVQEEELSHGTGFRYLMIAEWFVGPLPGAAIYYASGAALLMIVLALAIGFRSDRSQRASIGALAILLTAFLVLLTPHYPWYYLALVPFLAIYPKSWTLWLLTVGGLQTYQAVPGELLPDYVNRQIVFHLLVLLAIARDARACFPRHNPRTFTSLNGDLPA